MTVWTPSEALLATAATGPLPAADPDPDQPLRDDVCTTLQRTVLMQLALCLRHVARVLAPLGASLRRTLSCTVYLNADKLQECVKTRLGPAPGTVLEVDAVQWLATKLCTVDDVLRLLAAVDAAECGGSGNDDGENDGENDSDDSDDDARATSGGSGRPEDGHDPPPVAVVFVRGIPRDCLVEVEVVAASEALPLSAFRTIHRGDVCFDQPDGDVKKGDDGDGVRATVDAWPLWRRPPDGAVAALDTAAEAYRVRPCPPPPSSAVPLAIGPGPRRRHTVETSCTWLRGGVCTGFCELVDPPPCQPQDQQQQSSTVSAAGMEAAWALRAVCRAVRALLDGAGMAPTDLRTLRIYHTVNNTDEADDVKGDRLRAAAADAVAWGLGVRADFPVLFVPTSPPGWQDQPHRASGTLFTVHFLAVDTLKLNSVTWIHGL
jgi:enamine deaminase RidA (YjgF/YER057c/UK114 family)